MISLCRRSSRAVATNALNPPRLKQQRRPRRQNRRRTGRRRRPRVTFAPQDRMGRAERLSRLEQGAALGEEQLPAVGVDCALDASDGDRRGDELAESAALGLRAELALGLGDPVVQDCHRRRLFRLRLQRVEQGGEPGADAVIAHREPAMPWPVRRVRRSSDSPEHGPGRWPASASRWGAVCDALGNGCRRPLSQVIHAASISGTMGPRAPTWQTAHPRRHLTRLAEATTRPLNHRPRTRQYLMPPAASGVQRPADCGCGGAVPGRVGDVAYRQCALTSPTETQRRASPSGRYGSSYPLWRTGVASQHGIGTRGKDPVLSRSVSLSLRHLRAALGEPPRWPIRLDARYPRVLAQGYEPRASTTSASPATVTNSAAQPNFGPNRLPPSIASLKKTPAS
jgi:hypothetical protein